ncbi:glycosyltransferase family 4 protein [Enterobacillus tribolii]|uniref:Glycosyltransferase involved in cell wall biosynthesis n=1 Tax=Enterobacillus tribolii TaxID=1487935 RepID=A0A370R3Q9_9GAMM|nr:glycosyltransferase family 4 protein [Enterobacillus tribolii]MBW7984698.1 glycosyltransferase [Enterobacillus tribolii]RDK96695.1 glycosyltransferase involved in cell wall biosynthesis [Enterobacillus tribolii]
MKKILVLTSRFPFPVIGGDRLRIYQMCKALSEHYELHLLSLSDSKKNCVDNNDRVFSHVETVYLPKWKSYLNVILSLISFSKKPMQLAYYSSSDYKNKIRRMINDYDAVFCHLVRTSDSIPDFDGIKIIDMTDAISLNYSRVKLKSNKGLLDHIYSLEYKKLHEYEKMMPKKFDVVCLISQVDSDYLFENNTPSNVVIASNGVEFDRFPVSNVPSKDLVFIGNMLSVQNIDAAQWFIDHVLPKLEQHGDFRFKIIGRISESMKLKFNSYKGVYATGEVDCVSSHAQPALAGICSVRLGAGVQNKVLEYMALGIPAIVSSVGAEGIPARPGVDFIVVDTPDEYVNSIIKLNDSSELFNTLSKNGRKFVENNQSWSSSLTPFLSKIDMLIVK